MIPNCYMAIIDLKDAYYVYRQESQEISPLYMKKPVVSVYLSSKWVK